MPGIAEDTRVLKASPPKLAGPLSLFGLRKRVYGTTRTLTADDIGCAIFTTGATTAVTYTLPAVMGGDDVTPFFLFINTTNENMVIQSPASNSLVAKNLATADTLTVGTANARISAMIWVFNDGTNWVANGYADGAATNGGIIVA